MLQMFIASFFLKFNSNLLVERAFFLLNASVFVADLELVARVG